MKFSLLFLAGSGRSVNLSLVLQIKHLHTQTKGQSFSVSEQGLLQIWLKLSSIKDCTMT